MRSIPVLLLCVAAVGCSPSASDVSTTTTVLSPSTTAPTTTTTLSPAEARASFVACLGDQGVEIPPSVFDADGAPRLGAVAESLETTDPAVQAAIAECSESLSATQAADLVADPEVRILVIDQLNAFTQCMHDRGVTDFPDPDVDWPAEPPYPPDDVPFDAPGFDDALASCQDVVGAFGLGNG